MTTSDIHMTFNTGSDCSLAKCPVLEVKVIGFLDVTLKELRLHVTGVVGTITNPQW